MFRGFQRRFVGFTGFTWGSRGLERFRGVWSGLEGFNTVSRG